MRWVVAFSGEPTGAGTHSQDPEITLGETSTESPAPTVAETTLFEPTVEVELPDG